MYTLQRLARTEKKSRIHLVIHAKILRNFVIFEQTY